MSELHPAHAVIIGVGLIGGSWAKNLRQRSGVARLTGVGRSEENLREASALGIIDDYQHGIDESLADADLFVVATPLGATETVLQQVASIMKESAVVTDVGSVKSDVVDIARSVLGDRFCRFVPGHPIAGTEKSGAAAAFDTLFDQRLVILTPQPETDDDALELVRTLWRDAGANIQCMDVHYHDSVLARTSHLPHMLAYAIVGSLGSDEDTDRHFDLASGGFYDFTRIASSDPVMWRDICLYNPRAITDALTSFSEQLSALSTAVESGNGDWLEQYFSQCRNRRNQAVLRRSEKPQE